MPSCIYHSDKVKFENARKDLQKLQILPKKYGPRLAMAVCSCRKNAKKGDYDVDSIEVTNEDFNRLYLELELPKWDTYPQTKDFVNEVQAISLCNPSVKKLLYVLARALDKNYTFLEQEMRLIPINIKQQKTSPSAIPHIIRKRKKSCSIKTDIILPLFGGNSKSLETTTGKGFCDINRKFDCVVQFDGEKTKAFMDKEKQKTVVTVWCKSRESLTDITLCLTAAAEKIQSEASRRHQREKERRDVAKANSRFFSEKSSSDVKTAYNFEMDRKEILSCDFEKKVLKEDKQKRYQPTGKEKVDPLIGGHCMNCLKMYDSLKSSDETCRYHEGYISYNAVGKYHFWTCCNNSSCYLKPTHEEHSSHGCKEGRHVWRPHLKASRGDKSEHKHWTKVFSRYKH
ncbi:uncharacterized protein [Haliotis asinina]|uniref:uncharacterized protein n=1 Tax=Haliotis asinina TaxID=109174 RepID=UPI0035323FA5